ncbi:YbgC/FadM family acyl-CoA thioesterase [Cereibacter changlensis]|nr:YbgC/FadM family acyl-CoA thioesterase [Cereibacter changlensis]
MILRVHYEDTDFSGIAQHTSYLRFLERARSNYLRLHGISQGAMFSGQDAMLVVRSLTLQFLLPARMDDLLQVTTRPHLVRGASVALHQQIRCGDRVLLEAEVRVAYVAEGRPGPLPPPLRAALLRDAAVPPPVARPSPGFATGQTRQPSPNPATGHFAMRFAVASQNFRTVTGHAGKTRRFLVFEATTGLPPQEVERFDLPKDQSIHAFRGDGPHPLDSVGVVIAASAGDGFIRRMAARGVVAVATAETDPALAVSGYLAGTLSPEAPHEHDDAEEACGCAQG